MNWPLSNTHPRRLTQSSLAALREAQTALKQAQGFAYLPCLVDAEDSASRAFEILQTQLPRQALPLHWPRVDAHAPAIEIEQASRVLSDSLNSAIARLPDKSLLYLNASAWSDSPLLGAWPQYLNTLRESLRRKRHALVVMWPQSQSEALMAGAPDLWSMRMLSPWIESEGRLAGSEMERITTNPSHAEPGVTLTWRGQDESAFQTLLRTHSLEQAQLSWADALALFNTLIEHGHQQKAMDLGLCLFGIAQQTSYTHGSVKAAIGYGLGLLYQRSGQPEPALAHGQEAVTIYRRLAQGHPEAFERVLAMSLSNLSIVLSALGQRESALTTAQEVVDMLRPLAKAQPQAFEPDLTKNLTILANSMSALGQFESALSVAQEAVDIYRRLVQAQPLAVEPGLAVSLSNLANILSAMGQRQRALSLAQEAVEINRRLAQAQPLAVEPTLASSLNNLACILSNLGQHGSAVNATHEAMDIYRRLAQAQPQVFEHNLAGSLNNLASFLSALGKKESALVALQDVKDIYRRLAQAQPQAFEPYLAMSLNNLAEILSDLGKRDSALSMAQEAVALYKKWAALHPDAFAQNLTIAQNTLEHIQNQPPSEQESA